MSQDLKSLVFRLAFSKKCWRDRIRYTLLGLIFLPVLAREESLRRSKGLDAADASAAGDDVYPLF